MNSLSAERGAPVIVRTYGGRPEVRFLWEERPAGFIVTEQPGDGRRAVGIPASDVFRYDAVAAASIVSGGGLDWFGLRPLRD